MAEQGSEQGKDQTTPPITSINKGPDKGNHDKSSPEDTLMEKLYAQGTKGSKKPPKTRKPSDPTLPTRQVEEESKNTPPPKRT